MVSQSGRRRAHQWTPFEHHTLLCLIAKQVQITGVGKPGDNFRQGKKKKYFDLAGSIKNAHHSVAEQLNSALSDASGISEIPHIDVSDMIDVLLSRRDTVKYMERQPIAKVTRAMKRVWNRGLKFDTYTNRNGQLENLKKQNAAQKATDMEKSVEDVDSAWGLGDQVDALMADSQDVSDPWGEEAAVASFTAGQGPNPSTEGAFELVVNKSVAVGEVRVNNQVEFGHGRATLVAEPSSVDPLGAAAVSGGVQEADDIEWGVGSSNLAVTTSADHWTKSISTFDSTNIASSGPWTASNSEFINAIIDSSDLPAGGASAFVSTAINSSDPGYARATTPASDESYDADISMSDELDSNLDKTFPSLTVATSSTPSEHSPFTIADTPTIAPDASAGIDPERLAMLEAIDASEDGDATQEKATVGRRGENSIPMLFNRLEMMQ